ncbi:MAG: cation:proton antiporter [Cyanobacteria bacterium J06642_2]
MGFAAVVTLASAVGEERLSLAVVILDLALVYLTALMGGELCRRLGLPSLVGELLGGIFIGVSGLRLIVLPRANLSAIDSVAVNWVARLHGFSDPHILDSVFRFQSDFFQTLASVGVIVLLFETGLGANLSQLIVNRSQVIAVAGVGVFLSIVGGSLTLNAFWDVGLIPALFVGVALSVTSLGITSQLLQRAGDFSTSESQAILGAAMLDDALGIVLLSLVLAFHRESVFSSANVLRLLVLTTAIVVISVLVGRAISPLLMRLQQVLTTRGRAIVPALMFAYLLVLIASVAQLATILGAFLAGLSLQGSIRRIIAEHLRPVVDAFVPIFFVYIGAETDLRVLWPWRTDEAWGNLGLVVFLTAIAIAAKVASGYALSTREGVNPLAVGLGMVPRGEVVLVFAELGRISGILDPVLFATLTCIAILTTFATSFGLHWFRPQHISVPMRKGTV